MFFFSIFLVVVVFVVAVVVIVVVVIVVVVVVAVIVVVVVVYSRIIFIEMNKLLFKDTVQKPISRTRLMSVLLVLSALPASDGVSETCLLIKT